MKSWKTTAAGVLSLVALICSAVSALLDSDPETNPDWNSVATAAVAVGVMVARDNNVSSKELGL